MFRQQPEAMTGMSDASQRAVMQRMAKRGAPQAGPQRIVWSALMAATSPQRLSAHVEATTLYKASAASYSFFAWHRTRNFMSQVSLREHAWDTMTDTLRPNAAPAWSTKPPENDVPHSASRDVSTRSRRFSCVQG